MRRARRARHRRPVGDVLSDLYALLWLFLVYGGVLVVAVRRHLATTAPQAAAEPYWIALAALLATVGLAWMGLRSLGPVLATPAEQAWGVSTPIDRRSWLLPRLALVVTGGAFAGAALAAAVGLGLATVSLRWTIAAGALGGMAMAATAAAVQGGDRTVRWPGLVGPVLLGAGALTTLVVMVAHQAGRSLSTTGLPGATLLAAAAVPLAGGSVTVAVRRLARVDRAALDAGAQLASSTLTAVVGLDLSLLSGVLEMRRWRRVGRVSTRPFRFPRLGRAGVLLQAEVRRLARRPGSVAIWGCLALAHSALVLVAPSAAGVGRLVLAYAAVGRLASGLRALARSPGLRRALGGEEWPTRLIHLVVPGLGAVLWWWVTAPAGGGAVQPGEALLVAGVVGAVYRSATRPPLSYDGAAFETPVGMVPLELLAQVARGADLLGATIVLQWLMSR